MQGESNVDKEKGQGLNLIFHGNPGTGKTLAAGEFPYGIFPMLRYNFWRGLFVFHVDFSGVDIVDLICKLTESFAQTHQIPLYTVTCGELGNDTDTLGQRLQKALIRTTNWRCILLLEDCELLIQIRNSDIQRGAIVSSFLHHLYSSRAVVIMTTNRVTKFDPDFLSYVRLPFRFPNFDFDTQKTVWKNVIDHLQDLTSDDKVELRQWVDYELGGIDGGEYTKMNGRQIGNCINAASALARGSENYSE